MLREYEPNSDDDEETVPYHFNEPNLPHSGGILFQQWVCDAYNRAEAQRLAWVNMNHDKLRADTYQGLVDVVNNPSFASGETQVGKQIILLATYIGSPRAMQHNYVDALSIVRRYGKPDFFITMTTNHSWIEVKGSLCEGEHVANRPDIVARVFKIKFRLLLDKLLKEHVLGKVVGYTWVIEFQKRGLPHGHILLILQHYGKPQNPEDVAL